MEENNLSFEQALNKLKEAVSKLESGEINLDEAFNLFEQGLKYAKICEGKLKDVEDKVAKIVSDGKEENFEIKD